MEESSQKRIGFAIILLSDISPCYIVQGTVVERILRLVAVCLLKIGNHRTAVIGVEA